MIRLTFYVILCVIVSMVAALPTLALADDFLTASAPKIVLKSTLPSLNDLSIPQTSRATVATAQIAEAQPFSPPADPQQLAQLAPAAGAPVAMEAAAPAQVIVHAPAAVASVVIAPGPQLQATQLQDAPAFAVSYGDVETAISQVLTEKGAGEKISATINGRTTNAVFSYSKPMTLEIRGLTYDKPSGHWSANVLAMSGEEVISAVPAAGHYEAMTEVPVFKRAIRSGEIIAESDIAVHDFPITHVRSDTVTDITSLIGKSPLRGISPLRPIRMQEITEPMVMKKNATVAMKYNSDGMEISTSGQAMEDGAKGSLIAVRNIASKKIVHAIVEDAMTVNVTPDAPATASVAPVTIPGKQAMNVQPVNAQVSAQGAQPYATN